MTDERVWSNPTEGYRVVLLEEFLTREIAQLSVGKRGSESEPPGIEGDRVHPIDETFSVDKISDMPIDGFEPDMVPVVRP